MRSGRCGAPRPELSPRPRRSGGPGDERRWQRPSAASWRAPGQRWLSVQKAAVPRFTSASGTRNFQARRVSWSIRRRGSVARIQMKPTSSARSFAREPGVRGDELESRAGGRASRQEQRHRHPAQRAHPEVFGHEEQRILEARVLGEMAGDQLAFGLGQVERGAVRLGERRDHEDREAGRAPWREARASSAPRPTSSRTGRRQFPSVEREPVARTTGTKERRSGSS